MRKGGKAQIRHRVLWTVEQVAEAMGEVYGPKSKRAGELNTEAVRTRLLKLGAAHKIGNRWFTCDSLLKQALGPLYWDVKHRLEGAP